MIAPCRIVVVDAAFHGDIDHLERGLLIDDGIVAIDYRQSHRAESENGEALALKIPVKHVRFPPCSLCEDYGEA